MKYTRATSNYIVRCTSI